MAKNSKTEQVDFDLSLKEARPHERYYDICLRGDLWARIDEIDTRLIELNNAAPERFVGNPEAKRLTEELEALQAEMKANTHRFVFRAIPKRRNDPLAEGQQPRCWAELVAAHPPRRDSLADERAGYNRDDFAEALMKLSLASPVVSDWDALIPLLSPGQYDGLTTTAWQANTGEVSVPFSQAALKLRNSVSE